MNKTMLAVAIAALVCLVAAPVASADPAQDVEDWTGTCIVVSPDGFPPVWIEPDACLPPHP
jgi:hypothetical protein